MTEARMTRMRDVLRKSQKDLGILLENVHDPHNLGAILRSCDAVGVREIFVLYSQYPSERFQGKFEIGKKSASNVRKWIDVRHFTDREACFEAMREKYDNIWATHLGEASVSLYDLDLSGSAALVFGNERAGISQGSLELCDGNFSIPMYGFAQSLNVSVSCAIALYEASRQRLAANRYRTDKAAENEPMLLEEYAKRAERKHDPAYIVYEGTETELPRNTLKTKMPKQNSVKTAFDL